MTEFSDLNNKILVEVTGLHEGSDEVKFICLDGSKYLMYHHQDCCEHVSINDVCGDVADLQAALVVSAEEVASVHGTEDDMCDLPSQDEDDYEYRMTDSRTWTFYKIQTNKGAVTIRWLGVSNGYYSERVDFISEDEA